MMEKKFDLLDTYTNLEEIGSGAGGIVYKAYHKRLREYVVLKKFKNPHVRAKELRREADILKKLSNSYLPKILDVLEVDGDFYTVMDYIPGESLMDFFKNGEKCNLEMLVRWGKQLCAATSYLHSQNPPIIHGDIKPANIMLRPDGNICLIDFNISFYLNNNNVLGFTSGYTSPEQYTLVMSTQNKIPLPDGFRLDERADIYSIGATLYFLATGMKIRDYAEGADLKLLADKTSEAYAKIIEKSIKNNPARRYQSAYEMFKAFDEVYKKDRANQNKHRGKLVAGVAGVGVIGCLIILAGYGMHRLKVNKADKYNELVAKQIEYRENGEYDLAQEAYEDAVSLKPAELESYYQNACTFYDQESYAECIVFIEYDICGNDKLDLSDERMADVYYLLADSYYQLGDYDSAVDAYSDMLSIGTTEPIYYRDYAIALAYAGSTERAEIVLEEAIELGLEDDGIYYTRAEIAKRLDESDLAIEYYNQCIAITDDDKMKARAYLMISAIYEEAGDEDSQRTVLKTALDDVDIINQMQIIQSLAQLDINLADKTGNSSYRIEAIELLCKVIDRGWDTYTTYDTLAVLYQLEGALEDACDMIDAMMELYGEQYNTYMRYAFLELDIQSIKDNSQRDYSHFADYYSRAMELYNAQLKDNDTDTEMELLMNQYEQVVAGGWLG